MNLYFLLSAINTPKQKKPLKLRAPRVAVINMFEDIVRVPKDVLEYGLKTGISISFKQYNKTYHINNRKKTGFNFYHAK